MIGVYVDGDKYEFCEWCGKLLLINELRKEVNLGYLCDECRRAIESRGEKLTFED